MSNNFMLKLFKLIYLNEINELSMYIQYCTFLFFQLYFNYFFLIHKIKVNVIKRTHQLNLQYNNTSNNQLGKQMLKTSIKPVYKNKCMKLLMV